MSHRGGGLFTAPTHPCCDLFQIEPLFVIRQALPPEDTTCYGCRKSASTAAGRANRPRETFLPLGHGPAAHLRRSRTFSLRAARQQDDHSPPDPDATGVERSWTWFRLHHAEYNRHWPAQAGRVGGSAARVGPQVLATAERFKRYASRLNPSTPESRATLGRGLGVAACAGLWLRSGGCAPG